MKYDPEQMRSMAQTVLADLGAGGARGMQLVLALALRLGLNPNAVVAQIRALAGAAT
jgi:hypothetical protein